VELPVDGQAGRGEPSDGAACVGLLVGSSRILVRTFKPSNDPRFDETLIEVVVVYLNP